MSAEWGVSIFAGTGRDSFFATGHTSFKGCQKGISTCSVVRNVNSSLQGRDVLFAVTLTEGVHREPQGGIPALDVESLSFCGF